MSDNIIEFIKCDIEAIKKYDKNIASTYVYIARRLYELKQSGYIEKINFKDYKNIYDLSLHEFGYEKAKTNYLLLIYDKFFKNYLLNHKKSIYEDYSISQLRYMLDMSDEQIKQCSSSMTVRQIKEIKSNLSTRVDNESIENTEKLQNCIPGQNIITGVFPEKKEEEKVKTIIVSEIPKAAAPVETKTVTTVTETITQNNDFVPNSLDSEVYIRDINRLIHENSEFQNILNSKNKEIKNLKHDLEISENIITYAKEQLHCYFQKSDSVLLVNLVDDLGIYKQTGKLPSKVNFFVNVV